MQSGLPGNKYGLKVTGVQPNSSYIFSCWVAWDNNFNGAGNIVYFSGAGNDALPTQDNTDLAGSWISYEEKDDIRILLSEKYMELYKVLTGDDFNPSLGDVNTRIINNLKEKGLMKEKINES